MKSISFNLLGRYGRLGNSMFQYSAVLGAARSTGHTPCCNITAIPLLSHCFELGSVQDKQVSADLIYNESGFSYDPSVKNLPVDMNIDLCGYFQSEKYFDHVADEVKQNFTFKDHIMEVAQKKIPDRDTCVSVHVRRGDYVTIYSDTHPAQSVEYYMNSLNQFPYHRPVFFSDDIDWCKETFSSIKNDPLFIENEDTLNLSAAHNSDISGYIDMCAMTLCNAHIISNSSFSWWGAYLGGGKTIAPKTWFGPRGPSDWQDIYAKEWSLL